MEPFIALPGLHITRPFHTLLIDPSTAYFTLMVSFKRLYKDLTEIPAKNFLTAGQITYFVTMDIYKKSKPDECLIQFLEESIKAFSEIEKLIAIRHWIPNPGVLCSKPLGGSKVDSAFHPSEVDKMSTRNFWELNRKK